MFESFGKKQEAKESYVNLDSAVALAEQLEVELEDKGSLSTDSEESLAMKIQDLLEVQASLTNMPEQEDVNSMIAKLKDIEMRNNEQDYREAA